MGSFFWAGSDPKRNYVKVQGPDGKMLKLYICKWKKQNSDTVSSPRPQSGSVAEFWAFNGENGNC